ncbi:ABC transporter permease [uncultured Aquimarina sp.]|uniref:ABC transporter permease n=1 Tax=uncultured Aquimarina sp. TaxID=575652 RepID=UPI00260AD9E8|nr:ABC transporter permease subunit [uncultured Aquimarina sp.]
MKDRSIHILNFVGLGFFEPAIRLAAGEETKKNLIALFKKVLLPVLAVGLFLILWHAGSSYLYNVEKDFKIETARIASGNSGVTTELERIETGESSINSLPSPVAVLGAFKTLLADHKEINLKKEAFALKVAPLNEKNLEFNRVNADKIKEGIAAKKKPIKYTGRPSFVDQIFTSLKTVFAGFFLALFLAVPIGVVLGLSSTLRSSFNWLIQIFKPVSPVVWFLLVYMIVKTFTLEYDGDVSFIISFIAVGLCAMWATLVNTTLGVSTVDKDYINVAKVLNLGVGQKVFKIILPSSFPLIFTGLRITVSVAWMVLIAIELLSQSPGLGTFVWEEFQNGANDSNAKIIAAMFVIGGIGFLLDKLMFTVQKFVTFTEEATT